MAKIIKERERVEQISYCHEFWYGTGGFSFDCDKDGNLLEDLPDCAKENYQKCVEGKGDFAKYKYRGVIERKHTYSEPAVLKCDCGCEMELTGSYMGADECPKCGQWYNMFGQRLNPPSMWQEDY